MDDELLEALAEGLAGQDVNSFDAATKAASAEIQLLNTRLFPQSGDAAKKKEEED